MAQTSSELLARTLRTTRGLQDRSVRSVAQAADISAAYLMKLEKGEVASPSPHVLHRLGEVLNLDYLDLMRLAGYVVPDTAGQRSGALALALSSQRLTEDEAHALASFLQLYRSGKLR